MGNCCSDDSGGRTAMGGTAASHGNPNDAHNDAVDHLLKSRGYHGLFSQIEIRERQEASQLFDRMNAEINRNRARSNQAVSQYQTMTTEQLEYLQRINDQLGEDAIHNFGDQSHNINKCGCSIL